MASYATDLYVDLSTCKYKYDLLEIYYRKMIAVLNFSINFNPYNRLTVCDLIRHAERPETKVLYRVEF